MSARRLLPVCLLALVFVGGCGDITYQTRYIPRASELSWDEEHEQLPWQPPALGATHYKRTHRPAKPMFKPQTMVNVDWQQRVSSTGGDVDPAELKPRAADAQD